MSYVVNNHLNNLYVLSNKAIGPGKKSKINKRGAYVYSGLFSAVKRVVFCMSMNYYFVGSMYCLSKIN